MALVGGRGGIASALAREEADADQGARDGDAGTGWGLVWAGGVRVVCSYVAEVWTPAKLPQLCVQFAGFRIAG